MPRSPRAWQGALLLAFLVYASVSAAFLAVNMPPYQNADETNHFLRADNISRFYLIGNRFGAGDSGGIAAPEIARSGKPFDAPKFHPEHKVTRAMYAAAAAKFGEPGEDITFSNTILYPPFFYAPSVIAIWIGKATRMDVVQTLVLARLFTALASAGLIGAAIWLCAGVGATGAAAMILTVATLPMALSLQSACSQDGPMLGAAALAAALFVRLRLQPRAGGLALLTLCLALIAAGRPSYACLALIPLAAPVGWAPRLWSAALVLAVGIGWTALASATVAIPNGVRGADIGAQLRLMLDPLHDIAVLEATLRATGGLLLDQMVGRLGWLDVVLPAWFVQAALTLLAVVTLSSLGAGRGFVTVLTAALLSVLAVFVLIYLSWDPVGTPIVEGVQGRYFLPPLMMLAAIGTTIWRPIAPLVWLAAVSFPVLGLAVTMRAIVLRYYLGP